MCKSDAMKSGFLKSRNGPLSASVYVNSGRNSMDDLFNANVEALARNESGGSSVMCSQTRNSGNYYMKDCSNCGGSFNYYAMDRVAFYN